MFRKVDSRALRVAWRNLAFYQHLRYASRSDVAFLQQWRPLDSNLDYCSKSKYENTLQTFAQAQQNRWHIGCS
jgi:hypothetical protein